jgi:menaquinol-cytochrome c reductase iron-sulfur subunit
VSTETKQPEAGDGPRLPLTLPQLSDQAPQAPSAVDPQTLRRRKFLNWLCIGMGGASVGSIVWAVIGFMLAPLESDSKGVWRAVGKVDDFDVGSTTIVKLEDASTVSWAGYAGKTAAWLRRDGKATFTCFSINCTHLGCPVRWIDTAELFMCPCHGGVYYQDGSVAAGPPPKPLPQYEVRVRFGTVEVLASPVPITRGV